MILKNAFNKRKMYETLLENVPMLKELSVSTGGSDFLNFYSACHFNGVTVIF